MNQLIAVAFGCLAMVAASVAHAQDRSALPPLTGYMFGTGPAAGGETPGEPAVSPLFNFGGLDVGVWAPVEPHYSTGSDRDPAGEAFYIRDNAIGEVWSPTASPIREEAGVYRRNTQM